MFFFGSTSRDIQQSRRYKVSLCRRVGLLACLVLVSVASPALAQAPAENMLQEGILRFKLGKFRQSLDALRRASKAATTPATRGRIQLYMGLNHALTGDKVRARKALAVALAHDPTLSLDPKKYKPSLVRLLAEVRQTLQGDLQVKADSKGAVVLLDGKPVGKVPYQGKAPVGRHRVEVRSADGKLGYAQDVTVQLKKPCMVDMVLEPYVGTLTVRSTPSGAAVLVDGQQKGVTPLERSPLAAGEHRVTVRLEGHRDWTRAVKVSKGAEETEDIKLAVLGPTGPVVGKDDGTGSKRRRIWTWVAAGGAVAVAAVGVGLGASVLSDRSEYEGLTVKDQARLDELEQSIPGKVMATNVMFGVAGALAVTSVVLFFLEGRSPPQKDAGTAAGGVRLAPVLGRTSGLVLTTEF